MTAAEFNSDELSAALDADLIALAAELRSKISSHLTDDSAIGNERSPNTARSRAHELAQRLLDRRAADDLAAGRSPLGRRAELLAERIAVEMIFGLGILQLFVDDPTVENIDVNGCQRAFVTHAGGRKVQVGPVACSDDELIVLVRNAATRFGLSERRFDAAQPELDLRLPDGSRLSAVMAVTSYPVIDIRRHRLSDHDLRDLAALGMMSSEIADFLAAAVRAKRNILVSGAMNTGKTTLLRALAAAIPPEERIVTIEQALELGLDQQPHRHPDCVAMEARLSNTEGVGAIGMARLVRRSLRMNASRVIVGEVLGDEIIPMLNAMSQGRSGSMGTIHADSSSGVFKRIAAYAVQSAERLPLEATNLLIAGAIHYVVHVEQLREGTTVRRFVASIREVVDADGPLVVSNELWRPSPSEPCAMRGAPMSDRTRLMLAADHARIPNPQSP